jgi:hypothetical protein
MLRKNLIASLFVVAILASCGGQSSEMTTVKWRQWSQELTVATDLKSPNRSLGQHNLGGAACPDNQTMWQISNIEDPTKIKDGVYSVLLVHGIIRTPATVTIVDGAPKLDWRCGESNPR